MRLSAFVMSICLASSVIAFVQRAHAEDVFASDVFAVNDPRHAFQIEILSYSELMAQTPAARTAYLKNLQAMYLEALELQAANPHAPASFGANSRIEKMFALLEAFSDEAQAGGGGGRKLSGAEVSARLDAERDAENNQDRVQTEEQLKRLNAKIKDVDSQIQAIQTKIDQCKANPKTLNCNATTQGNRQSSIDTLKKENVANNAQLKSLTEHAGKLTKSPITKAGAYQSPNEKIDMSPGAVSKNTEAAQAAYIPYSKAVNALDACSRPHECTDEQRKSLQAEVDKTKKAYEEASAKMPSDPRSEPANGVQHANGTADSMSALHKKVVSCNKDIPALTCTKIDSTSTEGKARLKKIEDYDRKSRTRNRCMIGFMENSSSGACQSVHSLKLGKLDLNCQSKTTTLCNPWMYGTSLEGSKPVAICGDVPAKGSVKEKAVEIAKSCGEKSGKVANSTENFFKHADENAVKEGWGKRLSEPLNQLCGGPLRVEANCEVCQKLADASFLAIRNSGVTRKCDAAAAPGAAPGTVVK